MIVAMSASRVDWTELTEVPRAAVTLPLPLPTPPGFDASDPSTWPLVEGRLEYVGERLLFMAPSGGLQQQTAGDLLAELVGWARDRADFVVGGNEAGMLLGGEARAADGAVWKRSSLGPPDHRLPRVPPLLAVEIAGRDENADLLHDKARWYLDHGVEIVWLLFPSERTVEVITHDGSRSLAASDSIPPDPRLPSLAPALASLFRQISQP
jgi:Uma2 family endonuclease